MNYITVEGCELSFGIMAGTTIIDDTTVSGSIIVNTAASQPEIKKVKADSKGAYTSISGIVTITNYNGMSGAGVCNITGSAQKTIIQDKPAILEGDYINISIDVVNTQTGTKGQYIGLAYVKNAGQNKVKGE